MESIICQDYAFSFLPRLHELYKKGLCCDVIIKSKDRDFSAHRVVLHSKWTNYGQINCKKYVLEDVYLVNHTVCIGTTTCSICSDNFSVASEVLGAMLEKSITANEHYVVYLGKTTPVLHVLCY